MLGIEYSEGCLAPALSTHSTGTGRGLVSSAASVPFRFQTYTSVIQPLACRTIKRVSMSSSEPSRRGNENVLVKMVPTGNEKTPSPRYSADFPAGIQIVRPLVA